MGVPFILVRVLILLGGLPRVIPFADPQRLTRRRTWRQVYAAGAVVLFLSEVLAGCQRSNTPAPMFVAEGTTPQASAVVRATQTPSQTVTARTAGTPGAALNPIPTAALLQAFTRTPTPPPTASSTRSGGPTGVPTSNTAIDSPVEVGMASAPNADEPPDDLTPEAQPSSTPTPQWPTQEPPPIVAQPTTIPPSPTRTPTSPAPTRTPTSTRTPTPTRTPTSTRTPTPTRTLTPTRTPTVPPATATPVPTVVANLTCIQASNVHICAWVSNAAPGRNSDVTVSGSLVAGGAVQPGLPMHSNWHYKSTTSSCEGSTNDGGVASCKRNIGSATLGFTVLVDVQISYGGQGYKATTSFTPR